MSYSSELVGELEKACNESVGIPYEWGTSDCFIILNKIYMMVGLPLMDSERLYQYLGDKEHHPTRDQVNEALRIIDAVTLTPEDRLGSVAIITANGLGFGTMMRFDKFSFITTPGGYSRMSENRCINRVVRIESYNMPRSHLVKQ